MLDTVLYVQLQLLYQVYQFVIAINHFKNELYILEHQYGEEQESQLDFLEAIVMNNNIPKYEFSIKGTEETNMSDAEFLRITQKGKEHFQRGTMECLRAGVALHAPWAQTCQNSALRMG